MPANPSATDRVADGPTGGAERRGAAHRDTAIRADDAGHRRRLRPSRERLIARLPLVVMLLALAGNAVMLLQFTADVWFWADDWDLLFLRGIIPGADVGLLAPHNSHWLLMEILIYRGLFEVFGLGSYLPWAVTEIVFHLAVSFTTYLLLRRVGARPWAAVGGGVLIMYFGEGANAELWAASMNHVGALLFGLLAAYVVARVAGTRAPILGAAALLVVAVMFSGTALAVVAMVFVFAAGQRGFRYALAVAVPPTVVFGTWYLSQRDAIDPLGSRPDLSQVPTFIWTGMTGTLGEGTGLPGAGPLLLGVVVGCLLIARPEPSGLVTLAGAGLVGDVVQLVLLGVGRFGFGPEQVATSHYAYINIVLLAPAMTLVLHVALGAVRRSSFVIAVVALLVFATYAAHGWTRLTAWHDSFAIVTGANDEIALGIRDAYEDGQRVLTNTAVGALDLDYRPSYVVAPQIRAALPERKADPKWRLEAEGRFFTGVGPGDYGLARPGDLEIVSGLESDADVDDPGCHDYTATAAEPVLQLSSVDGNEIVVWSSSTLVKTKLLRGDDEGSLQEWPVEPGAVHIATSAHDTRLLISFNGAGDYQICKQ